MSDTEFLDELAKETEDPFAHLEAKEETDTPAESSPANNDGKEEPKEGETPENTPEKPVPFHEHPRWKEREEKLAELEAFKAEAEAKLAALDTKAEPNPDIPAWFVTLYGENPEAWEKWNEANELQKEQIKREIIEEQVRTRENAQKEEQKWNQWIEDEVQKLKDEGLEFDRNELIKTVLDYGPTDEHNNYDFRKAYGILQLHKTAPQKPSNEAKKKIADMSSSGRSGETAPRDYVSSVEIRKKSWNDL